MLNISLLSVIKVDQLIEKSCMRKNVQIISKGSLSEDDNYRKTIIILITHILYQFLLQIQTFLLSLSQRYYNTKYT